MSFKYKEPNWNLDSQSLNLGLGGNCLPAEQVTPDYLGLFLIMCYLIMEGCEEGHEGEHGGGPPGWVGGVVVRLEAQRPNFTFPLDLTGTGTGPGACQ